MVAYLCSAHNQSNIFKRYNNFHLFSVGLWKSSRAATRKNAAAFLLTAVPRHRLSLAIIAKCLTHYEPDTPPQDLRNKVVRQLGSQAHTDIPSREEVRRRRSWQLTWQNVLPERRFHADEAARVAQTASAERLVGGEAWL